MADYIDDWVLAPPLESLRGGASATLALPWGWGPSPGLRGPPLSLGPTSTCGATIAAGWVRGTDLGFLGRLEERSRGRFPRIFEKDYGDYDVLDEVLQLNFYGAQVASFVFRNGCRSGPWCRPWWPRAPGTPWFFSLCGHLGAICDAVFSTNLGSAM